MDVMKNKIKRITNKQTPHLLGCLLLVLTFIYPSIGSAVSKFEIKPETVTTQVGKLETVQVWLTSDQKILASDFEAYFSTELLEVVEITKGNIFDDYPALKYENNTGLVAISGISTSTSKSFTGSGLFATITFKPKKEGNAQLSLNFVQGSTVDSNVIPVATKVEDIRDDLSTGAQMLFQIGNFEGKPVVVASPLSSPPSVQPVDIENVQEVISQNQEDDKAIGGGIINTVTKYFRSFFGGSKSQNQTDNQTITDSNTTSNQQTQTENSSNESQPTVSTAPRKFRITDQPLGNSPSVTENNSQSTENIDEKESSNLLYLITIILVITTVITALAYKKRKTLFKTRNHNPKNSQPPIIKL